MHFLLTFGELAKRSCWLGALFLGFAAVAHAQSTDMSLPTPVRENEVTGAIAARDIGDARLTDHFYAFTGTPGDLVISVESKNLNGDIDVFTAGTLRPLLKITVYAESPAVVSKGIYLRKREDLVLRVEARSPNDDEGSYRIRFGGSFEPITGGPLLAGAEAPTTESGRAIAKPVDNTVRRVSSVGARVAQPVPPATELALAPTSMPALIEAPSVESAPIKPGLEEPPQLSPNPKAVAEEESSKTTAEEEPAKTAPARSARGRRPSSRRTRSKPSAAETEKAPAAATAETKEETKGPEAEKKEETVAAVESEIKPAPAGRRGTKERASSAAAAKPPEPEPESGARLIIDTKDGMHMERFMNSVRRVAVENGQIVVVRKDGKIERVPMWNLLRMTIEP